LELLLAALATPAQKIANLGQMLTIERPTDDCRRLTTGRDPSMKDKIQFCYV
jgi:hypothetical protein